MCSPQIKIIELPSKTPVCTLVPEAKLGMVMCIKLWQVSARRFTCHFKRCCCTIFSLNLLTEALCPSPTTCQVIWVLCGSYCQKQQILYLLFTYLLHYSLQHITKFNNRKGNKMHMWDVAHYLQPNNLSWTIFQVFLFSWQQVPAL